MLGVRIPVATYRLQFSRQFRFQDARALVHYLNALGISDLYASPILKARQGSQHGYDVTDSSLLNPELGTEAEFEALVQSLKQSNMGILLDIVPNHMAASSENPWWVDFLENGLYSPYAAFFDIDWDFAARTTENKVVLPVLDSPYEQVMENHGLTLTLEDAGLSIIYHGSRLPLDIGSYHLVLSHRLNILEARLGSNHPDFQKLGQLIDAARNLPSVINPKRRRTREQYQKRQAIKEGLLHTIDTSTEITTFILENIALFNGEKDDRGSSGLLERLLEQQVYRLAFWKTAREYSNYRRFFDINDLIGVRVEEPEVFEAIHTLIFRLIEEGKVTGLRIDHIDGLYDPLQYLSRLQSYIATKMGVAGRIPDFYVIVEKILSGDEALPEEWPVFGTTGYDFLNMVNAVFVDGDGIGNLGNLYSRLTGSQATVDDIVYQKKRRVIDELFPGEVRALGNYLAYLAEDSGHPSQLSAGELTGVIAEVTACLPVYRTYIRTFEIHARDRAYLEYAFKEAERRNPASGGIALDFLRRVLLPDFPDYLASEQRKAWLHFVSRWQQFTGAIMAKGFEDTVLYTCNRLVSLNEVGGNPRLAGFNMDKFHERNISCLVRWPHTLTATSTHDTKRSEDVRARIDVLSEISGEWEMRLTRWRQWNEPKKQRANGLPVPEPNTEALLYQTLVGAWPLWEEEIAGFKERFKAYIVKAVREAKVHTTWLSPNKNYENALVVFVESILEYSRQNDFLEDFLMFEKQIAHYGAINSLAQVLLKITSPGVPDFYQGTELWDFSLVDPDNRRAVDFDRRAQLLDELVQQEGKGQQLLVRQIVNAWQDGRVKLYTTCKALNIRRLYKDVFQNGQYIPLEVSGRRREHVCAFGRSKGEAWVVVVVPRLLTKLVRAGAFPLGRQVWGNDLLLLPEGVPDSWTNAFTGETLRVSDQRHGLRISSIMGTYPVALLTNI